MHGNGNGNGNGHRPPLVDLAFTKGAAAGSGLAAFTLEGVRIRVFGGAQDGVGKCALGGEIQVLKARTAPGTGSAATWARASPTAPSAACS